jgi:hypothetical protein
MFIFAILVSNIISQLSVQKPAAAYYDYYLTSALQRYFTENLKQIFPEEKLLGHSPYSYIHVSVCDLYILPILLQENR